jgi:protein TonB
MFDDFAEQNTKKREGRGRRSLSAILSIGVFVSLALGVGGAIAAHKVRELRAKQDLDVRFEDIPKPKAPKPKVVKAAPQGPRKAAARKPLVAPKAIPAETPKEAEGELQEAEAAGPVDGFTDGEGSGNGNGNAPVVQQKVEEPPPAPPAAPAAQERDNSIVKPRYVSGCRTPDVPEALQKAAATIEIDVRMTIGSDGRVTTAKVVKSHPLVPDEVVLSCVRSQVFEPAHLPDGTAVPFPFRRRFLFRPA